MKLLFLLYNIFIKDQQYIFINGLNHKYLRQYFHFVQYRHQLMDQIYLIFLTLIIIYDYLQNLELLHLPLILILFVMKLVQKICILQMLIVCQI